MDTSDRSECLEGTRIDYLRTIMEWASFSDRRVLWFHGLAGCGKSTLATSIANIFREQGRLGAFVFFNRDVEERNQASNVVRTIAHQLGSFDTRIRTAMAEAIETIPNIAQLPLHLQFLRLLVEPLSMLPTTDESIVIVLDALDECGNASSRAVLLALLAAECKRLPSFIRIFITSRTELNIRTAFTNHAHILVQEMELASPSNTRDILLFIRHRMAQIRSGNQSLQFASDWPGLQVTYDLAQRADGLFIWASTACLFIDGHDPCRRLEALLRGDANSLLALDTLYQTALNSAGQWDDEDFSSDFRAVMAAILVARNPLSTTAIDNLLLLDRPSLHTISRLGCVLRWRAMETVQIIHQSFADFLSSRQRCGSSRWHIDTSLQNEHMLYHCINYLDRDLKQNICNLKLSPAPVNGILPEAMAYASEFWIDHVCSIDAGTTQIADFLEHFLFRHLLHWLEVMSIIKKIRVAITSLRCLLNWLTVKLFILMSCASLLTIGTDTCTFSKQAE